jgi:hypothetical protein
LIEIPENINGEYATFISGTSTNTLFIILYFSYVSHLFAVCYVDLCSLNGSSSTSETFNNPCLSHTQEFKIKDVEVHTIELYVLHKLHFFIVCHIVRTDSKLIITLSCSCGASSMPQNTKRCSRSAALKSKEFGICDRAELTKLLMVGANLSPGVACTVLHSSNVCRACRGDFHMELNT